MIQFTRCRTALMLAVFVLSIHSFATTSSGQVLLSPLLGGGEATFAPPPLKNHTKPMLPPQGDLAPLPLDSGPIHEAFANPVELDAQAAMRVAQQPPEPINELPPEIQPEGKNVHWIPGYWMWYDVRNDFVWVSGVYRDYPPNRRWTPGYWDAQGGEHVWISGFWAPDAQEHLTYLPQPPQSLDLGPTSQAPGENYFWVPGCWNWRVTSYRWRPGYWNLGYEDWLWIPSRYCYTPRGSVYVTGYWDRYPLYRRGLLYAPVYWNTAYYRRPGYYYRPLNVINTGLLIANLFVHDRHHHYCYGPRGWNHNGYSPWYRARSGRSYGHRYDPLVAHSRWRYGHNSHDWNRKVASHFRDYPSDYRRHTAGRGQGSGSRNGDLRGGHGRPGHRSSDRLVRNANHLERDGDLPWKLHRLNAKERAVARTRSQEFKKFSQGRTKFERASRTGTNPRRSAEGRPAHSRIAHQARSSQSSRQSRATFKMPVDRNAKSRRSNANTGVQRAQHTSRGDARTPSYDARTRPGRSRETNARTPATGQARTRQAPGASRKSTKFSRPQSVPSVRTGSSARTGPNARTRPSAQTGPNARTRPNVRTQPTPRARTNSGSGARTRSAPRTSPRPAPTVRTRPTPSTRTRSAPTVRPRPTPSTRSRPSARPSTRSGGQSQKPARVARSRPTASRPSTRSAPRSRPTQTRSKPSSTRRAASPSRPSGGNRGASASRSRSGGASSRSRGGSSGRSAGPSGGSRSRSSSRSGGGSNRGGSRGKK